MVAIMLGADNGFFYAGQVMHFSSPFTVFLIYHKQYWMEDMLNQLFEPHQIRHEVGNFKYDAKAEDMHYLSFLDSDIVKLRSVRNHIRKNPVNLTVICFKEQVAFLKSYLGESVKMRIYEIGEIMDTLECERRTGL